MSKRDVITNKIRFTKYKTTEYKSGDNKMEKNNNDNNYKPSLPFQLCSRWLIFCILDVVSAYFGFEDQKTAFICSVNVGIGLWLAYGAVKSIEKYNGGNK